MTHRPDEDSSTKRRRIVVRSGCGFFIGACAALATMTHHVREDYYPLL